MGRQAASSVALATPVPVHRRVQLKVTGKRSPLVRPLAGSSQLFITVMLDPNTCNVVNNPQGLRTNSPSSNCFQEVDFNPTNLTVSNGYQLVINGTVEATSPPSGNGGCQASSTNFCFQSFSWPVAVGKATMQVVGIGGPSCSSQPCRSPLVDVFFYNRLTDLPRNPPCTRKQTGQGTGRPCDVATGEYWYENTDFSLAGPFGISFTRVYDNQLPTPASGDLGIGWRSNYDAYLDLTQLAGGQIIFRDEYGLPVYFTGVVAGSSQYDNDSGDTLTENSDGSFTLTTWHGTTYDFDASGRLTALVDRIGNKQTLTRNSNGSIASVTDPLGRKISFAYDTSKRIVSVTSTPSGVSLAFAYDTCGSGNLCSATESDGQKWTYTYGNASFPHSLTSVTDPLGDVEEATTFDGSNRVATQTTGAGQNKLTFNYVSPSETQVTDALGNVTTYMFDPTLLVVTSISGPLCACGGGQSATYSWDPFLRLTSYTDGDGPAHTITLTYGDDVVLNQDGTDYVTTAVPRVTAITEPLSSSQARTIHFAYSSFGSSDQDLPQMITLPSADTSGQKVTIANTFSANGLLTKQAVTGYVSGTATTYSTGFIYDSRGRLTEIDGPRTDVVQKTLFSYFSDTGSDCPVSGDLACAGQLKTLTDALGHVTRFIPSSQPPPYNTYTVYGEPGSMSDPNGVVTRFTYDARGRQLTQTLVRTSGNLTTSIMYDRAGRPTSLTFPAGNGVEFTFDSSDRLTSLVRFAASTLNQEERLLATYNGRSDITQEQAQTCPAPANPCAAWTTTQQESFGYDGFDRLTTITHPVPSGSKIVYGYDAAGNLTTIQDENHTSPNTTLHYDDANRVTSVVQVLTGAAGGSVTTSFVNDVLDDVTAVTDPNGNVTTYRVDDFGRVVKEISPVSGTSTYGYDADNNLTTMTDGNGATTTTVYDALDRPTTSTAVHSPQPAEVTTWTWDAGAGCNFCIGRLASMADPSTGSGHITTYSYEERGLPVAETREILGNAYSLAYGYDANGNRSLLTYPDGTVASYVYDFADRPYSVKVGSTNVVTSAGYLPFGPIDSIVYGNGTKRTATYDLRYRPVENKLTAGSTTLADYTYAEDALGNITHLNDTLTTGYSRTFAYDDLDRLVSADAANLWGNWTYKYDALGNLTQLTQGSSALRTFSYSGTTSKLTQVVEGGVTRPVSYDSAGNETSVGSPVGGPAPTPTPYAFTYSPRNLLASAGDTGGTPLTYLYDGFERRAVTQGISGSKTRFSFYDPMDTLLSESALISSGKPSIAFDYIWFGELPVAQDSSGTLSYTFDDHLGTPILQTNSSAAITWRGEYEPYGSVYALRGTDVHQPLRLPGQVSEQFDTGANGATERSYNVFRWYRPSWGRYTQADPLGMAAGSNWFAYAVGNPILIADPQGLKVTLGERLVSLYGLQQSFGGWYHMYLVLEPDYPNQITGRWHGYKKIVIEALDVPCQGHPLPFLNKFFYDTIPNKPGRNETVLPTPLGETDTSEIQRILNLFDQYPNFTYSYSLPEGVGLSTTFINQFNSNAFIAAFFSSSLFKAQEGNYYFNFSQEADRLLPGHRPGEDEPIPMDRFTGGGACGCP
jgi:RHS repeat-associated protein